MVRVLMCHSFKDQKVFSDAYEPTRTAYSLERDLVFVCTAKDHVFVYSLAEDGFPLLYQFPLLSVATDLICNDTGDFIFTNEMTRKDKPNHFTARVYFNWSKWRKEFANRKTKVLQLGFSFAPCFALEPNVLTAVEVQSRFSVRSISCCPVSTNIAVATETTVSVYRRCAECPFDFQRLYIVEPGFSIYRLVICEQFVAFSSASEVRVLQVTLDGEAPSFLEQSISKDGEETEQLLLQGISLPNVTQREVFDEHFVVWSFDRVREDSADQSAFWESILGSKEWQEGEPETDSSSTPTVIELPSLKDEVPFIDYSQDACEVLGPVQAVHGHPIKVLGAINDVQSATMLYRYFEADLLKTGRDVITELHSLQLLPFYTSVFDANEKPVPQLSGMTCFVSPPKKGFLYNVFGKTKLISHCTYTTETAAAVICNNMLYAATSQALETYVTHTYPAIAKSARARRPLDVDDKLYTENPGELTNGDASEDDVVQNNDTAMTDLHDGVLSNSDSVLNNNPEANKNEDGIEDEDEGIRSSSDNNKFTHFGFPVYDLEILQKPCPSPSGDLCMIGVHQFPGLFSILAAGSRILLLSDTSTNPSPKKHSKKTKGKAENATKDWTLHVLKAMDMRELYHKMENLTEKSGNLTADLRLLKEQHFILRSQFQVGHLSKPERQSLLLVLQNSVKSIGDYYARYATEGVDDVILYYTMANLSIEEILDHHIQEQVDFEKLKERKFGNGLLRYLNDVFKQNLERTCITLPQTTADKVLYVYANADPTRLSTLILRPLLEGYTSELAIKLLLNLKKTKTYSFSAEDYLALAIVYLRLCSLEEAIAELSNLTKEKLAEICVKHHYILYEKDETLRPLGQLLRRRLPKVFVKTLVSLHLRNLISLPNTIRHFQGKDDDIHNNNHLLEFLELLLNDSKGIKSFKETRELLVGIYLKKLSQNPRGQGRELLKLSHYHIPRGSGHFARRFLWLDTLPPFNGYMAEPKDCPIMKANMAATSSPKGNRKFRGFARGATPTVTAHGTGTKSSCTCCCCWEILLKLQSLLCSRYCDGDLGSFVLSNLIGKSLPGEISITLLCLPLIGEYEKAVETLLLIDPSMILTYAKQYFGESYKKWRCILDVLTQKIRCEEELGGNCEEHIEILKETLVILSRYTTPSVFLSLLPEDGNFAFFLPYLVESCWKDSGNKLSNQVHAR